jgi:hypothetical protein
MVARILLALLFLTAAKAIYNTASQYIDTNITAPIVAALQ